MKKFITIFLTFLICSSLCYSNTSTHKVLKIVDGDTLYIDFNNNSRYEKNERVRLNGIDTFETRLNNRLNIQQNDYNLSTKQILGMGYLAKSFAIEKLLNKNVKAEYTADKFFDKNQRHLMSVYYYENNEWKSYEQEILKEGLAEIYPYSNIADTLKKYQNKEKLRNNIKNTDNLNLYILNSSNGIYHAITCPNAWKIKYQKLINIKDKNSYYIKKYKPAKCCISK